MWCKFKLHLIQRILIYSVQYMKDRFGNISITDDNAVEPSKKSPAPAQHRQPQRKKRKPRSAKPVSRTTKLVFLLGILPLSLLGLYSLTGFVLFPQYIQDKAPQFLQERYSINSTIGSVSFNPYTFKLAVNDISVEDPSQKNSTSPLLNIQSVHGSLSPLELIRTNLAVKQLLIDAPHFSIIRFNENEYNFSTYFSADQLGNQDDFLSFAELPFLYSLNNIAITNGEIQFIDKPSGKNHQVTNLAINIPTLANFDYQTPISIQSHFTAELNGSPLEIDSKSGQDGNGLAIDLNQVELSDYIQYLPFDLPINIHSGKADGKLRFAFGTDKKITVEYQLNIEKLTGDTNDDTLHIEIPQSQLIGSYQPMAGSISFENVYLKSPFIRASESLSRATLNSLLPQKLKTKPITHQLESLFIAC